MANNKKKNVNLVYDKKNNRVVVKNTNYKKKKMPSIESVPIISNTNEQNNNYLNKEAINKEKKDIQNPSLKEINEINRNITITNVVKKNIPQSAVSIKEKNKKKYENRQKRYANNKTPGKKKILNIDTSNLEKVHKEIQNDLKKKEKIKKVSKEEKIVPVKKKGAIKKDKKVEKSDVNLTSTFRIKRKEIIEHIKEKSSDESIPLGDEKSDNRERVKRYLKEAIVYAAIITIINIIAIFVFDYVNYLKLFDVLYLNYLVTILLSFIISYIFAFFVDCLVTEIWTKIKLKKKTEGASNGDTGIK